MLFPMSLQRSRFQIISGSEHAITKGSSTFQAQMNDPAPVVEEGSVARVAAPVVLGNNYAGLTLDELGPAIERLHRGAEGFIRCTKAAAASALQCALEAGGALLLAKDKVPHGEWGAWLRQNIPGLSPDQATRYMKLAREIPHVRNFDHIGTIRQAYVAAGVIKRPAKGGGKKAVTPVLDRDTALAPADFASRFRSLRVFLEHAKPRLLASEMPRDEGVQMAAEVELILSLLRDIQGHVSKSPVTPPLPPTTPPSPIRPPTAPTAPLPPTTPPPPPVTR